VRNIAPGLFGREKVKKFDANKKKKKKKDKNENLYSWFRIMELCT
jgi:hypothetical protein